MAGFTFSNKSVLRFDTISGSSGHTLALADITAYVTGVEGLPGEAELASVTTLVDSGPRFSPGLKNATITLNLLYSSDLSSSGQGFPISLAKWLGGNSALFGSSVTRSFEFSPDSTLAGKQKLTGECLISSINQVARLGEMVVADAELQLDGVVTIGTH